MQKELNDDIAGYFLNDSRLFLERYNLLKPKQTEIGNRSKLMIDLVFSMECSLKAILFFQSTVDENQTYKKIRTHDLAKLVNLLSDTNPIQQAADMIMNNIDYFYVGSRYTLEANIRFRDDTGILGETYYSTIADPCWLESLYESANSLYRYAFDLGDNEIKIIRLNDIDIEHELEKTRRIRALGS